MSIGTNLSNPCNQNNADLFSDDFLFVIPSLNISQKIQTVLLPEIQGDVVNLGLGNRFGTYVPDRIVYSKLIVDMKLNQNLENYKSIVDWMKAYGTCIEGDPEFECFYKDMYLYIIDPTDGSSIVSYIHYKNCFPIAVSNPSFDPTLSTTMRITVNFSVEDFEIIIPNLN